VQANIYCGISCENEALKRSFCTGHLYRQFTHWPKYEINGIVTH